MEKKEITKRETTSDLLIQMVTNEKEGLEFTEAFLKSSFLSAAVDALFYARRQAGLTQKQVAEKMQTKQAAIARLEADTAGSMSLRRYVEMALACGMVPLDIKLVPINEARDYVMENPAATRTADTYSVWLATQEAKLTIGDSTLHAAANAVQEATTAAKSIVDEIKHTNFRPLSPQLLQNWSNESLAPTVEKPNISTWAGSSAYQFAMTIQKDKGAAA